MLSFFLGKELGKDKSSLPWVLFWGPTAAEAAAIQKNKRGEGTSAPVAAGTDRLGLNAGKWIRGVPWYRSLSIIEAIALLNYISDKPFMVPTSDNRF